MNWMIWVLVLVAALGVWGGFRAWPSPSVGMTIQAAVAILISGNLLFMTWLWRRARPGSGDAVALPSLILLSVSMLIGLIPRLVWPAYEELQITASAVSVVFTTFVVIAMFRRNRRLLAARRRG